MIESTGHHPTPAERSLTAVRTSLLRIQKAANDGLFAIYELPGDPRTAHVAGLLRLIGRDASAAMKALTKLEERT